ncbi:MAG: ParB/RepB/Spo0J family partition protein [Eubacterium sp.]|nr:ParB/RepB/Spo0J family partition protein [Eubacterium sp.]
MAAHRGLNKGKGMDALFSSGAAKKTAKPSPDTREGSAEELKEEKKPRSGQSKSQAEEKSSNTGKEISKAEGQIPEEDQLPAMMVRISQVVPNKDQPRKKFDQDGLEELSASIKEHGVLQPLLVQKKGRYYEIIAGERRWKAAKLAGIKKVPVIVRELNETETLEISLIENIQRRNLNAIEEAKAYQRLTDDYGLTQEQISQKVSKSRTAITNSLRLLKLTDAVQGMVVDGQLTMGHARALLALEDSAQQESAAGQVVKENLSVRDTEKLVKDLLNPKPVKERKKPDPQLEAVYAEIEERLKKATGTKVSIKQGSGQKGKIEIEYYSADDLERIINLIG